MMKPDLLLQMPSPPGYKINKHMNGEAIFGRNGQKTWCSHT
jgi:hypothetical protein